jgi:hypothetical protein
VSELTLWIKTFDIFHSSTTPTFHPRNKLGLLVLLIMGNNEHVTNQLNPPPRFFLPQPKTSVAATHRPPRSAAEAVKSAALALECVHDVHGGDRLAAGVLRVGDGVADDVLEEDLEHAAGLLVDEPGDALHAAPPRQPPNRRLGDALDVVAEDLAVTLRSALAQTLPALAAPRHDRLGENETVGEVWRI